MVISSNIVAAVLTILGRDLCRRLRFPQGSLPNEPSAIYEGLGSFVLFISGIVYFLMRFANNQAPYIRPKQKNFMYNSPTDASVTSENRIESRIEKAKRWVNSNFQGSKALQHQARRYLYESSFELPRKINLRQNASRFIPKYFAKRTQNWRAEPNDERYNVQSQRQPSTSGISSLQQDIFSNDAFAQPKPYAVCNVDKPLHIVDTSDREQADLKIKPVRDLDKTFGMPNKNLKSYDCKRRQQWKTCSMCPEYNSRNGGLELNSNLHPKASFEPHQSLANNVVDSNIKKNYLINEPRNWEENKIDEPQPSTSDGSGLKNLFQQNIFPSSFCSSDCNCNHNHDHLDASLRAQHLPMLKHEVALETNRKRLRPRSSSGNVPLLNGSPVIPNLKKPLNKKALHRGASKKQKAKAPNAKRIKFNQNIDLTTELDLRRKLCFKPQKKLLKAIKKPKKRKCPLPKRKLQKRKNSPKKKGRNK